MFQQLEPMSAERHGHLRLRRVTDYRFAAGESQVPLVFSELPEAAKHFPVVFPVSSPTRPVALLGDGAGSNRFVDDEGRWTAGYVPAYIRRYPFALAAARVGSSNRRVVLIDPDAAHIHQDEGEPLYPSPEEAVDDSANTTGAASAAIDFLQRYQRESDATPGWFEPLFNAGILVERSLDARLGGVVIRRIAGIRVADRERLAAQDDATLAAWARDGRLRAIHAHLSSLGNVRRLIQGASSS